MGIEKKFTQCTFIYKYNKNKILLHKDILTIYFLTCSEIIDY